MGLFTIKVKVEYAWWWTYLYNPTFEYICHLMVNYIDVDFEPNWDEYIKITNKAVKIVLIE